MALVFDATAGGSAANSFVSEAEAADLLVTLVSTVRVASWTALSSAVKQSLLMRATSMLETYFDWSGRRTRENVQKLGWPRDWVRMPDGCDFLPADVIPERIKSGTVLLALLLNEGFDQGDASSAPLDSVKIGPIEMEFANSKAARSTSLVPSEVIEHLRQFGDYIGTSGLGHSVGLVRA